MKLPKINLLSPKLGLAVIIVLTIISYGEFYNRGPASDDLCLYNELPSQSWYDTIYAWKNIYDSRIGHGILVSSLYHLFSSDSILSFHWNYFQLFIVLFHVGNVVLIFVILGIFNLPAFVRLGVALLFAVHPIKNAVIFTSINISYVSTFFIFLACTLFYFLLGKKKCKGSYIYNILIFTVLSLPVLTVEQILPLIPLLIILKYTFLDNRQGTILVDVVCFTILTACFLIISFSGATIAKIDYVTGGKGLQFDFAYVFNTSLSFLYRIIVPPFAYPYNEYVRTGMIRFASNYPMFLLIPVSLMLALILSTFLIKHIQDHEKYIVNKKPYLLMVVFGVFSTLLPITPLILVKYGIPGRASYIPMLGVSLSIVGSLSIMVAFAYKLCHQINSKYLTRLFSYLIVTTLTFLVAFCLLTNLSFQQAHSKSWEIKKDVISTIKEQFPSIPQDTKIFIFGMPKRIGPSPIFYDSWGLTCALKSLYQYTGKKKFNSADMPGSKSKTKLAKVIREEGISATTIEPISSMLGKGGRVVERAASIIPYVYRDNQLMPIESILLLGTGISEPKEIAINYPLVKKYNGDKYILKCLKKEIFYEASVSDLYKIKGFKIFSLPEINQIELEVDIEPKKEINQKYKMFFHIFYKDAKTFITNDQRLPMPSGSYNNKQFSVSSMVMNANLVEKIRIGVVPVSSHWKKLEINVGHGGDKQILKTKDNAIEIDILKLLQLIEI